MGSDFPLYIVSFVSFRLSPFADCESVASISIAEFSSDPSEDSKLMQYYNKVLDKFAASVIDIPSIGRWRVHSDLLEQEEAIRTKLSTVYKPIILDCNKRPESFPATGKLLILVHCHC